MTQQKRSGGDRKPAPATRVPQRNGDSKSGENRLPRSDGGNESRPTQENDNDASGAPSSQSGNIDR